MARATEDRGQHTWEAQRVDNTPQLVTEPDKRRLDSFCALIEGSGVCSAAAFDPNKQRLIIAYNNPPGHVADNEHLIHAYQRFFQSCATNPQIDLQRDGARLI
jgi:hypothetical protein